MCGAYIFHYWLSKNNWKLGLRGSETRSVAMCQQGESDVCPYIFLFHVMNPPGHHPKRAMLDFGAFVREASEAKPDYEWMLQRHSDNGRTEHSTEINDAGLSVGRRPNNDLCLSHRTVSGEHARLSMEEGMLILEDLASTNGTFINGRRLSGSTSLEPGDVIHFGQLVFAVTRREQFNPSKSNLPFGSETVVSETPKDAMLYKGFDRLLNKPDIDPYFQPVIRFDNQETMGYEVLVRSKVEGLEYPDRIFRIAAMRTAEVPLSELCRTEGLLAGMQLDPHGRYFLNTHARELETPRLLQSLESLRCDFPQLNIVLEVHEAAITSIEYLSELTSVLKDLNIELAYDDFGAGQARLIELFEVPPKYLKFDLQMIRGLESASPLHRASVKALVNMVHDLDVIALAEGVETEVQAEICRDLGFDLAQGYLFGRPQPREFWQHTICSPIMPSENAAETMEIRAIR